MGSVWMAFRDGGWPNFVIVFFGLVGLVAGLAAAITAAVGGRAARALGVVAVALAVVVLGLGAFGVVHGRGQADRATEDPGSGLARAQLERIRRVGYLEARSCAKFGLGAALVPLLGGAIALHLGRRRAGQQPPSVAVPAALLGGAVLVAAGDVALLQQKLPGREYAYDDPMWQILAAEEEIAGGRLMLGCATLRGTIDAGADPSRIPDLRRVADMCVDARIAEALATPSDDVRASMLREVISWDPRMVDEAHRKRIEEEIAKIPPRPDPAAKAFTGLGATGTASPVRALEVNGRLPPAVVERVLRQSLPRFRACYNPRSGVSGDVVIKFIIDRAGAVAMTADGGSTLDDPAVFRCIAREIGKLDFPQPEAGMVTVIYPLHFQPK